MATQNKRFIISLDEDLTNRVQIIKKDKFFDKSYAEMYRYLIKKGLESEQRGSK